MAVHCRSNDYGMTTGSLAAIVVEAPVEMEKSMPAVYRLLCQFYRQHPALAARGGSS